MSARLVRLRSLCCEPSHSLAVRIADVGGLGCAALRRSRPQPTLESDSWPLWPPSRSTHGTVVVFGVVAEPVAVGPSYRDDGASAPQSPHPPTRVRPDTRASSRLKRCLQTTPPWTEKQSPHRRWRGCQAARSLWARPTSIRRRRPYTASLWTASGWTGIR